MSKLKLKGWVDGIVNTRSKAEIASANWYAVKVVPDMVRGTLVIGEKAFTESEVRAMLRDLIEDQARCDVHNGWQSGMIPDFAGIASKHGVSLDPA